MVRTALTLLGAVALTALFTLFAVSLYLMSRIGPLTEEAKLFADSTIVAITTNWDIQAMKDRASPEFLKAASDEKLIAFTDFHRDDLGVLDDYDNGAKCQIIEQHYSLSAPPFARTVCYALIRFVKADAKIRLPVVKRDGRWAMQGFHLEEVAYLEEGDYLITQPEDGRPWPSITWSWERMTLSLSASGAAVEVADPLISPATGR